MEKFKGGHGMNFKKVMAAVLAGTMVFGMASSVSAATEVSFWTLSTRQNAVEPIVEHSTKQTGY